jgi:hypothetical protein
VGWDDVDWIGLAQDRKRWNCVENTPPILMSLLPSCFLRVKYYITLYYSCLGSVPFASVSDFVT